MNVARQAALKAGLPVEVPGETVNRVCGSGLQAVVHAVEAIRVGYVDTIVAGGTESMSNAPYLLKGARWGYRMGHGEVDRLDARRRADLRDQRVPHGHHRRGGRDAATTCRGPTRTRSPPRASGAPAQAIAGRPLQGGDRAGRGPAEEGRAGARRDRRVSARRHDRREAGGAEAGVQEGRTVTAGNASGINDGAAALVVTTGEKARAHRHAAAGAHPGLRVDRRRSEDHGHRAGAGGAEGARARAA